MLIPSLRGGDEQFRLCPKDGTGENDMTRTNLTGLRAFSTAMLFVPAGILHAAPAASPAAPSLSGITVSFKLDSRLSGPTYGGDHWVSPPRYMGANAQDTVEARAQGVDAKGRATKISPKWIPSDPKIVTVAPDQGSQVKILVKGAGESKLKVIAQGFSKDFLVKARYLRNAIQVEITEMQASRL